MKSIFIVGNSLDPRDQIDQKLLDSLRIHISEITQIPIDPTEEWPVNIPEPFVILDTVHGIDSVTEFTDLSQFLQSPRVTVHDFDLMTSLPLLVKLHKISSVSIIGIPNRKLTNNDILDVLTVVRKIFSLSTPI